MSTIIINPGDTEGTKWYKLGEIAKTVGTGGYTPPVYPIVYPGIALPNPYAGSSKQLFSSGAQKWLVYGGESPFTLTISSLTALKVGQEAYIYNSVADTTITVNPPSGGTMIGQTVNAKKGDLVVVKHIDNTTFCSYVTARAASVSVDVDGSNPQLGVTRDPTKLVYYPADTLYMFPIWDASYYTEPTTITCENPIYLTWKASKYQNAATNLKIDGVVYDQRVAGEHLVTAGDHIIGPAPSTYSSPYISGLRTP